MLVGMASRQSYKGFPWEIWAAKGASQLNKRTPMIWSFLFIWGCFKSNNLWKHIFGLPFELAWSCTSIVFGPGLQVGASPVIPYRQANP